MKKLFFIFLLFFFISCSDVDFIYENKKTPLNPLYQKTNVITKGLGLNFLNSYIPMFFGNTEKNNFRLLINIKEKKTKRSVESNQATSNLRYELRFLYTLSSNDMGCIIYEKEILSYFSIIPKSAGYNYGTDASLEKKYELAVIENLNQYLSFLSEIDLDNCL